METLTVCMVSGDFFPKQIGGQGIYAYKICEGLAKLGHEVYAVVPPNPERIMYYKKHRDFTVVFAKSLGFETKLSFSLQAYRKFREELGKMCFDVLHGNELFGFTFLLRRPRNIKSFVSISHNSYLERYYASITPRKFVYPILMHLEKMSYFNSDAVIVGSEMEEAFVRRYGISLSKIHVVYYGVDLDRFKPSKGTGEIRSRLGIGMYDYIVLFVGRMVERKKPHILVEAMKYIVKVNPSVHCVLVGDGDFRGEVESRVSESIRNNVHFVGSIPYDDLSKYYAEADVFALPSLGEGGVSLVVLEAAASGLPLILTKDASSWCPILQEDKNGFIVKPFDHLDLSEKILLALKNIERMRKESREIALKYFSWNACINGTLGVYRNILDNNINL